MKSSYNNLALPTPLKHRRGLFFLLLLSLLLYSKPAISPQNIHPSKHVAYFLIAHKDTSKTWQANIIVKNRKELDVTKSTSMSAMFALSRSNILPGDEKYSTEVITESGERSPPINIIEM